MTCYASVAQLVEHNLAKVGVASSNLVSRSSKASHFGGLFSLAWQGFPRVGNLESLAVEQRLTFLEDTLPADSTASFAATLLPQGSTE